ncbi:MAG: DMT family transporter [Nitrosomonadaceae bacterium]|nr:DMT family transporter [Nitrosomonadaceae bacterium]
MRRCQDKDERNAYRDQLFAGTLKACVDDTQSLSAYQDAYCRMAAPSPGGSGEHGGLFALHPAAAAPERRRGGFRGDLAVAAQRHPGTVAPVLMAIERICASLAAQTSMVGPMSTILMSVLILGEPFSAWMAAGTVLVIVVIFRVQPGCEIRPPCFSYGPNCTRLPS